MVLFLSLLALPLNAEFERFELNYNDEMIHGTLFSIQPRVDEFSTFIDGVYTRMIWADFGSGYQEVYNNQKDLTGLPEAAAEFYVASGEDDVFLVELRKTDLGNRGEGGDIEINPERIRYLRSACHRSARPGQIREILLLFPSGCG